MLNEEVIDNSEDTGAETGVSESLKKFVGDDGQVDVSRLQDSYLELEKKATKDAQARADAERAYAIIAESYKGDKAPSEDEGAAATSVAPKGDSTSTQAVLEMRHPEIATDPMTGEYADPEFFNGLRKYVSTMPTQTKQAIAKGDYATMDWAIRQFKVLKTGVASKANGGRTLPSQKGKGNFVESGSPARSGEGKVYTKAELRKMMAQNPAEYAAKSDEIQLAYQEGRVR